MRDKSADGRCLGVPPISARPRAGGIASASVLVMVLAAGFLIYVADASGYAGSVGLLLFRSLAAPKIEWLPFFIAFAHVTAIAVAVTAALSALLFLREGRRAGARAGTSPGT